MDLTIDRRAAALAFYGPLAASPDPARRVGWDNAVAHALRLAAVADVAVEAGAVDVLDAGCGEAALLGALRRRGFSGRYRGEDVLELMIERARAAAGCDPGVELAVADAFAGGPPADVVLCSGALNTAIAGAEPDEEVARALGALWERAGRAVALDLAVADRHPPGVGIARADLGRAWAAARRLAPVVVVREDVVPGEALLVMSRTRAPAWARWVPDAVARATLLLDAGEPEAAVALTDDPLVHGRAAALRGALDEAERLLTRAAAELDPAASARARLELAPLWFRRGRRAEAEALLRELAAGGSDDARAHLVMLLIARRAGDDARRMAVAIVDPWIRREMEAQVANSARSA
ncbi:MAG: methyltransferase domain-containing protein [Deltaproteobacteria bacterium]|nr:methyltransferase domain-containing protein [Deltaproteobacteria bacterium]